MESGILSTSPCPPASRANPAVDLAVFFYFFISGLKRKKGKERSTRNNPPTPPTAVESAWIFFLSLLLQWEYPSAVPLDGLVLKLRSHCANINLKAGATLH